MTYLDSYVMPALRARGVPVVDVRGALPRNTTWSRLKKWSTRPVAAIQLVAWHYPATPLRPSGAYDELLQLAAWARGHIARDWGNGYHAPTIAYSTAVMGSGTAYLCNDWEDVTWHSGDANGIAVGFLIHVGEGQQPNSAQRHTMQALAEVATDAPALPVDTSDHYGHGELTAFGNATACPGLVLPHVQRYRATGYMDAPPPDPPPPPPEEPMEHLSDEQIKEFVLPTLWGLYPYQPFFGIAQAWVDELRAGRYRGAPITPEVSVPETDVLWQRFESGLCTYKASNASYRWTG